MLRFTRSGTSSAQAKPRIADGAGAKAWLAGMSQPGSIDSLLEIVDVLEALGARGEESVTAKLHPQKKYAIAERIRGVLLPVLWERAREDSFATLPVPAEFTRSFWTTIDATVALRDCYAWLVSQLPDAIDSAEFAVGAKDAHGSEPPPGAYVSRTEALQRALETNAQSMLVMQRARWQVPMTFWERHCVLGQLVRDLDCQDLEINDALRMSSTKTCRAAFVLPVMVALADPASRSPTEFDVIRMAAQRWSSKMGFRIEAKGDVAQPLGRPVQNPGPSVTLETFALRFDTQSTMSSIDKRLDALAAGKTPREVGIGDTLRPQAARDLLLSLRSRWGAVSPADLGSPDRVWRAAPGDAPLMAVVAMPRAKGHQATDLGALNPVSRSAQTYAYHRESHGAAITKPRTMIESERIEQLMANAETWSLIAEAPDAFRCLRRHGKPRLALQRLVALRPGANQPDVPFLIGWIDALTSTLTGQAEGDRVHTDAHQVRIRLAPGLPIIVRASVDDAELDYAFLLVPRIAEELPQLKVVPAGSFFPMKSDASVESRAVDREHGDSWKRAREQPGDYALVVPHSTFRAGRLLRVVRDGSLAVLRLEELVLRGADFDLARFVLL